MRIGVAGLRGLPGVMGGVEAHAQELYPRLAAIASDFDIEIAMRRPYASQPRGYWRGVTLRPMWATRNKYLETVTHTALAIAMFSLTRRREALHLHAIGPGLFVPFARLFGLRVLLTHHGQDYNRAKWNLAARLMLRTGEWASVKFANEVIVVSESITAELRGRYPDRASHISFIPNGISTAFMGAAGDGSDAVLSRFGLRAGGYVLAVGRLVPEKGFHELIAAHARSGSPYPLVIAGSADHEDDYVRDLRSKVSESVSFLGFQDHATLRSLYGRAGLFVLPSHHEGLPIAALEAIGMGAPTLLSNIPANLELALPIDHYFPVGDIERLAAALARPFHEYAVDGPAIAARYDWDRIASETAAVIRRLR